MVYIVRPYGFIWLIILLFSCATYYDLNYEFNRSFETGNLESANKLLDQNKKRINKKSEFLYLVNKGLVLSMLGDLNESNRYFEEAYIFAEDYQKDYVQIATSYFTNPTVIQYRGEDHEHLMVLYYKALNYCKLGDYEAALVECRRLNNRLYELSDKYKSDLKYKEDAFIHNFMGLIYEASGDYNNAFIAYENSVKIYENSYSELFGLNPPHQLKKDLLRTAYLVGFDDKLEFYKEKFEMNFNRESASEGGELIFFWHNGLGPVKDEWSINFTIVGDASAVTFVNKEYGLNFTFPVSFDDGEENDLNDLKFIRVAFPKYVERKPAFISGYIQNEENRFKLELTEDINQISFKVLEERMVWEMSKSLLRVALKKAAEEAVRSENEDLGFVLGIVNAVTEKADTRNWQTLPYAINYTRVPLNSGNNQIKLYMNNRPNEVSITENFVFEGQRGQIQFHSFQSLH